MAHVRSDAAEDILDREFRVLDHGFVRLVDYMGGDERVVAAARVSYGAGTKSVREDQRLIRYLMRHRHTSPFEQVILTFHVKLPIFVARQWVRHRTARLNEVSARYSVVENEVYTPNAEDVRAQSTVNRQSRSGEQLDAKITQKILDDFSTSYERSFSVYSDSLDAGVARELSRIVLPLSTYTEWYWQIDLNNLFHFLKLRLANDAQYEIRSYASVLADIAKAVAPMCYSAFEQFDLGAKTLTLEDIHALRRVLQREASDADLDSLNRLVGDV